MLNFINPPGSSNANEALKLPAVGGNGGNDGNDGNDGRSTYSFDSGVILAPLFRIRIIFGVREEFNGRRYYHVIKRIYFEFIGGNNEVPLIIPDEFEHHADDISAEIFLNDEIVTRVDVWTDGNLINAVAFHTNFGQISPRYGNPPDGCSERFIFQPPHGQVVGMHGSCGATIDSLGFTFQSLPSNRGGLRMAQFFHRPLLVVVTIAQQVVDYTVQATDVVMVLSSEDENSDD